MFYLIYHYEGVDWSFLGGKSRDVVDDHCFAPKAEESAHEHKSYQNGRLPGIPLYDVDPFILD